MGLIGGGLSAAMSQAAVTVQSQMTVDGRGMLAAAAMTGTIIETIAGDRARAETQLKFKSGLVRAVARSTIGSQVEIVRLDQDRIYVLDLRKKRYRASSFADLRAQLARIESQSASVPMAFDASRCRWSAARSKLTRTRNGEVAGFNVQQWNIRTTQTCTDLETRSQCEVRLDVNLSLAPNASVNEEQRRYQLRYVQELGLASGMGRAPEERARALLGRYGSLWSESVGKMRSLNGQLLKSEFALLADGAGCAAGDVPPTSVSQEDRDAGAIGRDVASLGTSTVVTEKTGRWRLGDLSGELVGKLLSKNARPGPRADSRTANGPGSNPLLRLTYEILAINNAAADAGLFEIPGNFRPAN